MDKWYTIKENYEKDLLTFKKCNGTDKAENSGRM
jgi:hypothetical protein